MSNYRQLKNDLEVGVRLLNAIKVADEALGTLIQNEQAVSDLQSLIDQKTKYLAELTALNEKAEAGINDKIDEAKKIIADAKAAAQDIKDAAAQKADKVLAQAEEDRTNAIKALEELALIADQKAEIIKKQDAQIAEGQEQLEKINAGIDKQKKALSSALSSIGE